MIVWKYVGLVVDSIDSYLQIVLLLVKPLGRLGASNGWRGEEATKGTMKLQMQQLLYT